MGAASIPDDLQRSEKAEEDAGKVQRLCELEAKRVDLVLQENRH
jgi:hypothetical protein